MVNIRLYRCLLAHAHASADHEGLPDQCPTLFQRFDFNETMFGRIHIGDSADPDLWIQFFLVHADLQAFQGPEINVADPDP